MIKTKCKIERKNYSVQGHNGWGRFVFISGDGKRTIPRKTENQASIILGQQVMLAYKKFCSREAVDIKEEGVELELVFKKYSKKESSKEE